MNDPDVLLMEGSDFETFPAGGQLTMARCLMKLYGNRLALVGITRGREPVGRWTRKKIDGVSYWFFPVSRREPSARRPLIPARLEFYRGLRRHRAGVLSLKCKAAFLQAPEALLAVQRWDWDSLCFWFAGVESPLKVSRYPIPGPLRRWFDRALFSALDQVDVILAAAGERAINTLVLRSKGSLARERVTQLPTCVDTTEFHPRCSAEARAELGIPQNCTVFVNNGRIGRLKGWELLMDAFEQFHRVDHSAMLCFAGDGEDRPLLEERIRERNLESSVRITGFLKPAQIASYLNAADVAVFGSFVEGWSVSMLEALACGKPIVTTDVSGTDAMIVEGQNGFVLDHRDPLRFAQAMQSALALPGADRVSTSIADRFSLTQLGVRLGALWTPLTPYESGVRAAG
jgi:glycosyltransferase involved in cell wall biosynthesis